MMEKTNISIYAKSDKYYLEQIGAFVKSARIAQRKTQHNLAEDAGVNRSTLVQLESGHPVNLLSLIQVLRALKQLHVLGNMEALPQISPLKLAAAEHKQIQRVRRKREEPKQQPDW